LETVSFIESILEIIDKEKNDNKTNIVISQKIFKSIDLENKLKTDTDSIRSNAEKIFNDNVVVFLNKFDSEEFWEVSKIDYFKFHYSLNYKIIALFVFKILNQSTEISGKKSYSPTGFKDFIENVDLRMIRPYLKFFPGINLPGAQLRNVDLSGSNLSRSFFTRSDFSGANLSEADLNNTNLLEANLSRADLCNANLTKAILSKTNLSGADLRGIKLIRSSSHDYPILDLQRANLKGANLRGIDFASVDLSYADLSMADLTNASLEGANISGCILENAIISNTKF
jgi:uncharacterized protein YjbI with pentapeptide repeats